MVKHWLVACGVTLLVAGSGMAGGRDCDENQQRQEELQLQREGGDISERLNEQQIGNASERHFLGVDDTTADPSGTTQDRGTGTLGPTGSGATGGPPSSGDGEASDSDSHHGTQDRDDGFEGGDAGAEDPGNQHLGTPRDDDD